jgi:HlyD family secretion protein
MFKYPALPAVPAAIAAAALFFSCTGKHAEFLGSGTIEAREVTVSVKAGGTIVELPAEEGSLVGEGDLLARLDAGESALQLDQAEARLQGAQAELDLLLAGARREDIRQAEEQSVQALEQFELARKEAERLRDLFAEGSASRFQLDQAETALATSRARYNAAEAALDKAAGPARPQELQAARAQVREAESAVELARLRVAYTEVHAPLEGTVVEQLHEVGELLAQGTPVLILADLHTVFLTVYVPQPLLPRIRLGSRLVVQTDERRAGQYLGTVTHIAEQAEFTPSTVQTAEERARLVFAVKLRLENESEELKPGMPADAYLPVEDNEHR